MDYSTHYIYIVSIFIALLIFIFILGIKNIIREKRRKEQLIEVRQIFVKMESHSRDTTKQKKYDFPLFRAQTKLNDALDEYSSLRNELKEKWRIHYKSLSWWDKATLDTDLKINENNELITTELDSHIKEIEVAIAQFNNTYKEDILRSNNYFIKLNERSLRRLKELEAATVKNIKDVKHTNVDQNYVALSWLSGLSIPVSITSDLMSTHAVYNSLRSVNSNFEGMSNVEVWWETLFMGGEQLSGLVSLTKGAYFEKLVENDTGGQLHEHFNHPDTDITIDGIEYQIKATDSLSYINTVDPDIPVISTSEIAEKTNSIDSGYSNEELTESVQLALDGTMIDAGDTAVDVILTGAGSLGIFATIRGINHAGDKIKNGVDKEEAILEGMGVAVTATAKGVVDTAELAYKVASSAPSRAVGRGLWAVTKFSGKVIGKSFK